ncbi:multifunctional oxoglutarate decarboxylase/oxoglutarate dehydrogenase thiamine pyrophosphate-binding subunit/dihydrolipoyllysine-residue succinyltransferase subunit [Frankia sp. AiPa1]|uniref:multifunctional oxoglutarate decarboxylase/oxoglutarate dehydrogenase thiamine pyrophosphate-binding subunit/dihydrolipoyllysine-residue succinyltransferase subunit n=1 Tax=Frankia sp. AiPa1 TaxID=573492 RepID=UPI00202B155E|nr:multifunctional oxoglutarate decarboxylase/oxoglutarate dehydrogenase thiamine pyrophosphate-binding subunit/dihydrolipoyllysine-residue succinyltransferase subunit [Frankia sp. AiPa1]MCL9761237.1 multifunctional oxoglutarate decarboxylase/oxoglutarate dehydrogenase thiamine pyrophosphate-binding subunit/dihydrolipoyllysine-residue succinyltransferase subunit [Frankia sp. AiPa1]
MTAPTVPASGPDFGPNEWLVFEIYQQFLEDPESVSPEWREFLSDYHPSVPPASSGVTGAAASVAPNGAPTGGESAHSAAAAVVTSAASAAPAASSPAASSPASPAAGTPTAPAPSATPAPDSGQLAPAARAKPTAGATPAAGAKLAAAPASSPTATPAARPSATSPTGAATTPLRGAAARVVSNMETSLHVPTATSVRAFPAKLLADNRIVINRHLARSSGGKVSFTHIIGYAMVRALADHPAMNASYAEVDGKPTLVRPEHVGLGLAIDLVTPKGRQLVVAAVKKAEALDFREFWLAYEDLVRRARANKLTMDDFSDVTISLTNPGGIGTVHSVPRLMQGQGTIIGVGAMEYPAEFSGAAANTLARLAISKTITLTSTYDHRIIQGAQSGEYLRRMHQLLLGEDGFYDEIFRSLRVPYEPVRWVSDRPVVHEGDLDHNARVLELIHAYRVRGHLMADTNPLEFAIRSHPDLDIIGHGLTLWDLDREFAVGGFAGQRTMSLRDVMGVLRDSYCRRVGIEYMHIQEPDERAWIQARVERSAERPDPAEQLHVLERLGAAEAFESFLHTKYVGQRRFSLEGAESTIPTLDEVLDRAADAGMDEVVIGMAHRGRLNVLANIVGKSYRQIFDEFEGHLDPQTAHGSGDVKYHLGADGVYSGRSGRSVDVSVVANPSHLEAVDPVTEGVVRAKQDILDKGVAGFTVLPVLVHGDAAFAGQGVVAETLNLSQLRGYRTGGTIHLVINNQVGFTTSPESSRSSVYATDVARMVQAPIFHVNGDDPEACVRVAALAFEYRQEFHKDVVIDLVCYRRRGHNEMDEPSFTQPLMYDTIASKRSVRKLYTEALVGRGDITRDQAEQAMKSYRAELEKAFAQTRDTTPSGTAPQPRIITTPEEAAAAAAVSTAVPLEAVKRIIDTQVTLPDGFTVHPRLRPQIERRAQMVETGAIDWALAETLAFGSLLLDGRSVRLTGQDSRRGTFGQRHAVLVDRNTAEDHTPLRTLRYGLSGTENNEGVGAFYVYDSLLSEFAAMGFEYGYAVARSDMLVLWEAQFGDFFNGAQSIIDEFISAGEAKWGQRSSLVLLLPHGYEGQGPDHSSARIERFLSLCADGNMTVSAPSSPASYFHLLRRQTLSPVRRPLIVFTPKSMLRLKSATSTVEELTGGGWQPVIDDAAVADPAAVRRVLLTAGKIYYDLASARGKHDQAEKFALLRVEQLYPTPGPELAALLERYPNVTDVAWVQEEPANQGAYPHMALNLAESLPRGIRLRRISRRAAAAPASGSSRVHEREQHALVEAAFDN